MFDDQMMCTHRRFDVNAAKPLYDIFIVNYLVLNSNLFIVYTSYIESFLQIHCFDIYFNIFFICIIIHNNVGQANTNTNTNKQNIENYNLIII